MLCLNKVYEADNVRDFSNKNSRTLLNNCLVLIGGAYFKQPIGGVLPTNVGILRFTFG